MTCPISNLLTEGLLDNIRFPFVDLEVLVKLKEMRVYPKLDLLFDCVVFKYNPNLIKNPNVCFFQKYFDFLYPFLGGFDNFYSQLHSKKGNRVCKRERLKLGRA